MRSWAIERVDPFSLKQLPKWHPRRLLFTLKARWDERQARGRFDRDALPVRELPFEGTPSEVDWHDTEVKPPQLRQLLAAVRETDALAGTCVVEVGAYRGVTTKALAAATDRPYVVVDPYIGYGGSTADLERMKARTAANPRIVHERKTSGQAARDWKHGPVGMVFIDAVHDYVNVRFDLWAWGELLVPGGLLAFHDTDNPAFAGVRRAIREACPPWELAAHVNDLVVLRKPH